MTLSLLLSLVGLIPRPAPVLAPLGLQLKALPVSWRNVLGQRNKPHLSTSVLRSPPLCLLAAALTSTSLSLCLCSVMAPPLIGSRPWTMTSALQPLAWPYLSPTCERDEIALCNGLRNYSP